jgi:predicted RNA methylase
MAKKVEITPEVRDVLTRGAWAEEGTFHLPDGQLARPLYEACDKVLRALGGKWDRKARGHRFAADARQAFNDALADGFAVDQKRTLEQFFTPEAIAEQIATMAAIEDGMLVLEPSAGAGALARAALWRGANVIVIDKDSAMMPLLLEVADQWPDQVRRVCEDFLDWEPGNDPPPFNGPIDRVLMNPPFGRGADMAHVTRALGFLRPDGVLAAIMSPHWTFASEAAAQTFRGLVNSHPHDWTPLPEGSFRESGTDVNSGILIIRKGAI